MILDSKLNFKNHLGKKISKANKGIGIIRRIYKSLPRGLTCKYLHSFRQATFRLWWYNLRPFFKCYIFQMRESVQYNAALVITGAIHGSSRDKLYQDLGF